MPLLGELFDLTQPRVIGTYLYPYTFFGEPQYDNPLAGAEIIASTIIDSQKILISRNGGLFVQPPSHFDDLMKMEEVDTVTHTRNFNEAIQFNRKAADLFNRIICEFALNGIVSEPTTPVHMGVGRLANNHAAIMGGGGGREIYLRRTTEPFARIFQPDSWMNFKRNDPQLVSIAIKQACTSKLLEISKNLPTLVAGAYSLFSNHQAVEALVDGWIVLEQIVDYLWKERHLSQIVDGSRKNSLKDHRTYTVAVQIEILHTIGLINSELYHDLNVARKHRNEAAHRAEISIEVSEQVVYTMKLMIEYVCETQIQPPQVCIGFNW